MIYTIYGLHVGGSEELRYIGQTKQAIEMRLVGHESTAIHMPVPTAFALWLMESRIEIAALAKAPDLATAIFIERALITKSIASGHRLFNIHGVPRSERTRLAVEALRMKAAA